MKIAVAGSIAYDYIMTFPGEFAEFFIPGGEHTLNISFMVDKMQRQFGGTAGNIAYNLGLMEVECSVFGIAGKDFAPYRKWLGRLAEIDTSSIKTEKSDTCASAYIMTDIKDNQINAFYPGASKIQQNYDFSADEFEYIIISPDNKQTMLNNITGAKKADLKIIFDPGQLSPYFTKAEWHDQIFPSADILIGNDYEFATIAKNAAITEADLIENFDLAIKTLGEKGSVIFAAGEQISINVVEARELVDPTGAGDAYRAGFFGSLIQGKDLKTCGQIASTVAAYAVEKAGTQNHKFDVAGLHKRVNENFINAKI